MHAFITPRHPLHKVPQPEIRIRSIRPISRGDEWVTPHCTMPHTHTSSLSLIYSLSSILVTHTQQRPSVAIQMYCIFSPLCMDCWSAVLKLFLSWSHFQKNLMAVVLSPLISSVHCNYASSWKSLNNFHIQSWWIQYIVYSAYFYKANALPKIIVHYVPL